MFVWVRVRACALARAGVHARAGTRVFIGFLIQKIRRTPFHPDENHRAKTVQIVSALSLSKQS